MLLNDISIHFKICKFNSNTTLSILRRNICILKVLLIEISSQRTFFWIIMVDIDSIFRICSFIKYVIIRTMSKNFFQKLKMPKEPKSRHVFCHSNNQVVIVESSYKTFLHLLQPCAYFH